MNVQLFATLWTVAHQAPPSMGFSRQEYWSGVKTAFLLIAGGVVLATIPWVLYFGINHAIKDWLEVYLYDNLFVYTLAEVDGSRLSGIPISPASYLHFLPLTNTTQSFIFLSPK